VQGGIRQACCGVAAKPRLAHASNVSSQILSGLPDRPGLDAQPFIAVHGGLHVTRKRGNPENTGNPSERIHRDERSMHGRDAGTGRVCRQWP